ncbi:MAG: hypothetical protein HY909_27570 [Deltaproteobacteria bacterium]|nr:hypothetical protein [Deltaproteobacteria bacterium]
MHAAFDQFGKQVAEVLLAPTGTVVVDGELAATDAQRPDVRYEPDPKKAAERAELGDLGRMAEGPCTLELMHEAPSVDEMLGCLRKVLTWNHLRALLPDPQPGEAPRSSAVCWLLCGGHPKTAALELALVPMPGWPAGFLWASPGLPLRVVVCSQLPRTPATLPLRLLGAGVTLREAMEDLRAMPSGPLRDKLRWLVRYFLRQRANRATLAPGEPAELEATVIDLSEFQAMDDQLRREGQLAPLLHQFERKLCRVLTEAERETLLGRLVAMGPTRLSDVVLDLDGPTLDAWLRDPAAT